MPLTSAGVEAVAGPSTADYLSEVEARLEALDYNPQAPQAPQAAAQAQAQEREAAARSFMETHHTRREPHTREFIHWAIVNGFSPEESLKNNHRQNIERYFSRMAVPIPKKFSPRFKDLPADLPAVRPPSASGSKK